MVQGHGSSFERNRIEYNTRNRPECGPESSLYVYDRRILLYETYAGIKTDSSGDNFKRIVEKLSKKSLKRSAGPDSIEKRGCP
jgi:hypothetical protein